MTTSTATPRVQYTANGSQVNFTFNFSIADISSLDVYVGTTLKTYTTDYTITFNSGSSGTGTVVFVSAPAASAAVYLIRNTYNVRSTDFEQGGAFLASTINNELDRLTQGIQDIDNILTDKVFRLAEPTAETATLIIPAAATRANKILSFDASGNAQVTSVGAGTVTSVGLTTSDANITIGSSPVTSTGNITINLANPLVKNLTGNVTGALTGNADTATYASAVTLTADNSTNATNYPLFASAATGNLSPRTDTGFTYNPSTGVLTTTAVTGNLTGNVTGTVSGNAGSATYASAVTLTADNTTNATNYPLFTSAATGNLSPRTDTGFTYNPSTGILTSTAFSGNLTGAVTGNADTATYASAVTLTADNTTNATNYPTFVSAATGNLSPRTDTGFTYNPSTGVLTTTSVAGNLTGNVSGNVTGNVTGNADTATYASAVTLTADNSTAATNYPLFANAATGNLSPRTDTAYTYNPSTNTLTTGTIIANSGTSTFNDVIVNGDLTVEGTTTTINTTQLDIEDNIIRLATNQSGAAAVNAGIEVERGTDADKSLIWDESVDKWTIGSETFVAGTVQANVTGNLTGDVDTGSITVVDNNITATQSNDNINLITNGTGSINVDSAKVINVGAPVAGTDAATKDYVDTQISSIPAADVVNDTTPQLGGNLDVNGKTITSVSNAAVEIAPNGTGDVYLTADTVRIGDANAAATLTTNGTGNITISTNEGTNSGTIAIANGVNGNITLLPNGTGSIVLDGLNWPQTDGTNNYVLKTNGSGQLSWVAQTTDTNTTYSISAETVTGGANLRLTDSAAATDDVKLAEGTGITVTRTDANTITIASTVTAGLTDIVNDTTPQLGGSLDVNGNIITSASNGNIELQPNGSGDVYLTADTVRVGDNNADATITTNGTGDLILNTNAGSSSGSITIEDAANGRIIATPNGTGYVNLGYGDFKASLRSNNTLVPSNANVDHGANRVWSQTWDQSTASASTDRIYANNDLLSVQLTGTTSTNVNNRFRQTSATDVDLNGINFGYDHVGYKEPISGRKGLVSIVNTSASAATVTQAQGVNGTCEVGSTNGTTVAGDITITDAIGMSGAVDILMPTGRTATVTNAYGQYAFLTTGGAGTKTITNWYALYAADTSATVTNKYGLYIANDDHQSRLGTIERYKEKQNALTSSSTITVDCDLAPIHKVTLAVNTGFVITNLSSGQTVTIIIVQDGTGSRTATFGTDTSTTVKFAGGTPTLSTAASAIDVVTIYNDGTNFLGNIAKAFA